MAHGLQPSDEQSPIPQLWILLKLFFNYLVLFGNYSSEIILQKLFRDFQRLFRDLQKLYCMLLNILFRTFTIL